jgi:hypothetical protein
MGALIQHGIYAKSERAVKARNQGVRRIMNQMLAIAPWLSDSDRPALRAWSALEWLTRRVMLVLSGPGLERDQQLKWSAEYRALRATQNTIDKGARAERSFPQTISRSAIKPENRENAQSY